MRLIDANALIEVMYRHKTVSRDISVPTAVHMIDEAPTVEAVPVVHGHWRKDDRIYLGTCSECGDTWGSVDQMRYCPSCGAKMDEVE